MIYRAKQFFWAVTSIWKPIDKKITRKYLSKNEEKIFDRLKHSEKHHCIRVCNDALLKARNENIDINEEKLAKVALLHDIGKLNSSVNVIDKSILVLLDKFSRGRIRKYNKIKKIDMYYNHPKKGGELLKQFKVYDKEFIEVIEKHHFSDLKDNNNKYLDIIKECDDKN